MQTLNTKAGLLIRSRNIDAVPHIAHGFGVRGIGMEKYLDALGVSDRFIISTNQIHGNKVHLLLRPGKGDVLYGDAFITDRPGLVCFVRTADCVPILIVDTKNTAVAAVHAGWRGTVSDIAGETVRAMQKVFGSEPQNCVVAIGPRVCGNCYEVKKDVVDALTTLNIDKNWQVPNSKKVDLGIANRLLLERAGVSNSNITVSTHCTYCDNTFSSFRRDKSETERQFNFIVIEN